METSAQGIVELVFEEGEVLVAYKDIAGVWTIGSGLTKASGVVVPKQGMTITREQSRQFLREALRRNYEPAVGRALPDVKQHVFDGGVLFHFNTGAISRASWVKYWRDFKISQARVSFLSWNKAGGRVSKGLKGRREREWRLIADGVYAHAGSNVIEAAEGSALKRGAKGDEVADLQRMLVAVGYQIRVDGDFGDKTYRSVIDFQRSHPDLLVDGIAGTATLTQLQRVIDLKRKASSQPAAGGAAAGAATGAGTATTVDPGQAAGWGVAAAAVVGVVILAFLLWRYRSEIAIALRRKPL